MKNFRYLLLFVPLFFYTQVYADTNTEGISYLTSETELIISNNKGTDINLSPAIENNVSLDIKNIVVSVNYDFKASTNYKLELSTPKAFLTNVDNVSIISNSTTCTFNGITNLNNGYPQILFSCPSDVSYLTFGLSNSSGNNITTGSNFRWNYSYLWKINDTGVNLGPVIENNNQNTQNVIENNNQNTQDIIDSNKETQEVIKDQFNDCRDSYNLYNFKNTSLVSDGIVVDENGWITITYDNTNGTSTKYFNYYTQNLNLKTSTDYKIITEIKNISGTGSLLSVSQLQNQGQFISSKIYNFSSLSSNSSQVLTMKTIDNFDSSKWGLRSYVQFTSGQSGSITFRLSVINNNETFTNYEPFGEEVCSNKIDDTNDKLDGIQGALTDDSSPDTSGLADSAGWLPPGPLDSVLNLPLSLFNSLTTNLNKSCSPISIPLPYVNKNLTIPCINSLYDKIGISTFINWLGVIVSGLMLYTYLLKLYKWIEDRISLNETHSVDNWGGL